MLVIDVGGTHVKALVSGEREPRKFDSGPTLTARQMVAGVKKIIGVLEIRRCLDRLPRAGIAKPTRCGTMQSGRGMGWL